MRVVSVVGARPQLVKLAPVAAELTRSEVEHVIVHTGQHYDPRMSEVFFADLDIPSADVNLGVGSGSHGVQTGSILAALDPVLADIAPDWVVVYGDTNSTLAGALSAVKMHLPLAHLEAGLRSQNRRMPEEHNRVLTDHAADLCLAPTQLAIDNLRREGLASRSVLVGDVMTDVCLAVRDRVADRPVAVDGLAPRTGFVLATVHRADNTDDPDRLARILAALADMDLPVVLSVHPRLRQRADSFGLALDAEALHPVAPLHYPDMISAVLASHGVVTDSGGLQKEAYLLQRPCTTLRAETEWPETLVDGWNILAADYAFTTSSVCRTPFARSDAKPYGDGRSARAVAQALLARR